MTVELKVGIVGLGRAGSALRRSLRAADVEVVVASRRVPALLRARRFREVELLFVAVPDDALEAVALALSRARHVPSQVVHLSGSRGIDVLSPLVPSRLSQEGGAAAVKRGAFHLLASLRADAPVPRGTLVAVDADDARLVARLKRLARSIGCAPVSVPRDARVAYHAGAVVAANLAVALLQQGVGLLVEAGVHEDSARRGLALLLRSQAENIVARPLPEALTGPVARGDVETVRRHLAFLDVEKPALAEVYRSLSSILLENVAELPPAKRTALRAVLGPAGLCRAHRPCDDAS